MKQRSEFTVPKLISTKGRDLKRVAESRSQMRMKQRSELEVSEQRNPDHDLKGVI